MRCAPVARSEERGGDRGRERSTRRRDAGSCLTGAASFAWASERASSRRPSARRRFTFSPSTLQQVGHRRTAEARADLRAQHSHICVWRLSYACVSFCVCTVFRSLRLRSCLRLVSPFNDNVECACALLWVVSALWGQEPEEQDGQPLNQVSHIVYGAICLLYAYYAEWRMRYMRSTAVS